MKIFKSRRNFLVTAASMVGISVLGMNANLALAQDQQWPTKMIKITVPFPAGSITDSLARLLSENLSKSLGQSVIVENKGGANGSIGATAVARSAPDGYNLMVTNSSSITGNPIIYKNLSYKSTDFSPIILALDAPFVLNVNPEWANKHSINSVKDLVAYAKSHPSELSYGSAGVGNLAHLAYVMLSNEADIKTLHIPYKSGSQASMAVLAGEVKSSFDTLTSVPQIQAGKLKALAVTSKERLPQIPEVPTMTEAGFPDIDVTFWLGFLAPAGTPSNIIDKLYEHSKEALSLPAAHTLLSAQGTVALTNPKDFTERIARETEQLAELIKKENISLD